MRILTWHVHGSWTTSFVHGPHEYLLPVVQDRGPDGRGRARTWDWPAAAQELTPEQLGDAASPLSHIIRLKCVTCTTGTSERYASGWRVLTAVTRGVSCSPDLTAGGAGGCGRARGREHRVAAAVPGRRA